MVDYSTKRFAVISLGCDKNRVDTEKLLSIIASRGCEIVSDASVANIIIVNTCAFLNSAREEAIDTVLACAGDRNENTEKIVVCGCLPQRFVGELFPQLTEADVFLGINDYDRLFDALDDSYTYGRANFVGSGCGGFTKSRLITTPEHYAYLKIADGCDNRCTYCLIPSIRGKYVSYRMEDLLDEVKGLGQLSELILVAQDVTRYGTDLYGERKLCELLRLITGCQNVGSVRLLYCYPDVIDDRLIAEVRDNPKIIKYMDIPLQHCERRILKLMNRKGGKDDYLELIDRLRREIPGIAIRSTFISGFPSETEEECDALCEFLTEARFTNCGFFAYSREPGTPANKLPGQVREGVKRRRVARLYDVQREISRTYLSGYVGKRVRVLCDGIDYERGCFVGRAYFSAPDIDGVVYFNAGFARQGEYYDVTINSSDDYDLYGETEDYHVE